MTGYPYPPRKCQRSRAIAAADVHNAFAGLGPGSVDKNILNRREQDVLLGLAVGPAPTAWTVPIGDLVGVLLVACR